MARPPQRLRFPWRLGVIASLGVIAMLAFVIVTLLILQSQGMTQALNTLTILSIVVGFVISVLSFLLSYLQLHHAQQVNRPESRTMLPSKPHQRPPAQGNPASIPEPPRASSTGPFFSPVSVSHQIDWGEAPQAKLFYGRE